MATKLAPATGTVKWVGESANGLRLLEISAKMKDGSLVTETYEVEPVTFGYRLHNVTKAIHENDFICYRLSHIVGNVFQCNCPDAMNRRERRYSCKHVRGLVAAMKALPF